MTPPPVRGALPTEPRRVQVVDVTALHFQMPFAAVFPETPLISTQSLTVRPCAAVVTTIGVASVATVIARAGPLTATTAALPGRGRSSRTAKNRRKCVIFFTVAALPAASPVADLAVLASARLAAL